MKNRITLSSKTNVVTAIWLALSFFATPSFAVSKFLSRDVSLLSKRWTFLKPSGVIHFQDIPRHLENALPKAIFSNPKQGNPDQAQSSLPRSAEDFLKSPEYVYHGIPFDPPRLISIFENGFLTYRSAKKKKVTIYNNYGTIDAPLFNGFDRISLAQSFYAPIISDPHGHYRYAYQTFVQRNISFAIRVNAVPGIVSRQSLAKEPNVPLGYEGVEGEVFAVGDIPTQAIAGIFVPPHFAGKRISEVSFGLRTDELGELRVERILSQIERYTSVRIDQEELKKLEEAFVQGKHSGVVGGSLSFLKELEKEINGIVARYAETAFKALFQEEQVLIDDLLRRYAPPDVPIFATPKLNPVPEDAE